MFLECAVVDLITRPAPLIHFQKCFLNKVFYRLKLVKTSSEKLQALKQDKTSLGWTLSPLQGATAKVDFLE